MQRVFSGSTFEQQMGYARAVVDDHYIHISGTTGYDYQNMTIADSAVEQTEQCLRNIGKVLTDTGASFADVVRVNYILPRREDFEDCWPVLKKYFGDAPPAATMIVAGLFDPAMKIEIEVTAAKPG